MKTFSELLQAYFTERLVKECNASPHTIANYRDTFRLLIAFAHKRLKKPPTNLAIQDLDATFVLMVWSAKEVNQRKADRLPHEAGLKLLAVPRAPKELPA